ncbi:MAG: gliding motility-associated C-terminal domain-containing protein, partial [Bacteroidota bacterium]
GLCAGIYSVAITDSKGCSASSTDTIIEPKALDMTLTPVDAGCTCSGSITAAPFDGTPPYSYLWSTSPAQTAATASGLCAGGYSVTVTDNNGCTDVHADTIKQTVAPVILAVAPNDSVTLCSGTTSTLSASVNGSSTNITYIWMPGGQTTGTVTVSPASSTLYTVIATDTSSGCADTATVFADVIATPSVSISGPGTVCVGATVTLTGSGTGSYSWSSGATTTAITGVPTSAGTYSFALTVTNQSCSASDTFFLSAVSSPVVNVTATANTICQGISPDTLIATDVPGGNYFWQSVPPPVPPGPYPSNDTIVVSPDDTTIYTVYVSNSSGCSAVATYTVNVILGPPDPQINAVPDYCIGDSVLPVTGNSNPPNVIVWFNSTGSIVGFGDTLVMPPNIPIGTYTIYAVQGTDAYCLSDPASEVFTIHPLPQAVAGSDVTICSGHTAQLNASGGTTYLWSPPDYLNQANVFNPSSNPDSTITYVVTVTDINNCRNADTVTVFISSSDTCGIKIYQAFTPNNDDNNDVWWIDGINLFPDNSVEIYNRWGNLVWSGTKYDNKRVVWYGQNLQGQPLPSGTYFYVIDVTPLGRFSKWVELVR